MSKRKLLELVKEDYVNGWDDPRMPTIRGIRRRGYPAAAIRAFCKHLGVTKYNSTTDLVVLENFVRETLNKTASRYMAVLNPIKVVLTNYPEGEVEQLTAVNNPEDPEAGNRTIPFSRELYIEETDFMEDPPKKFFRLRPGGEVRLRYAYIIKCEEVVKDPDTGEIIELRCTYDEQSKSGGATAGRKVKGTLHWVSAEHSLPAEVRLYDHLFKTENPDDVPDGGDYKDNLNPESLVVLNESRVEPALADATPGEAIQFERQGYFCPDAVDSTADALVFNRTVTLRDAWAKMQKKK